MDVKTAIEAGDSRALQRLLAASPDFANRVTSEIVSSKDAGVNWLPNAPPERATEVDIFFASSTTPLEGWPGKRSMGTSLIGSIPLENGDTVWAVFWFIPMPNLSQLNKGQGGFYKGRTRADLGGAQLRALVFGNEADGSRVIYDCAVQRPHS